MHRHAKQVFALSALGAMLLAEPAMARAPRPAEGAMEELWVCRSQDSLPPRDTECSSVGDEGVARLTSLLKSGARVRTVVFDGASFYFYLVREWRR